MSLALKCAALALGAAVLAAFLREGKREFVLPLQLGCAVVMLVSLTAAGREILGTLRGLVHVAGLESSDVSLLLKGAAICVVTELCASFCRESGNASLGEVLVLAGRAMTVLLALPLVETVVQIAVSYCT